MRLKDIMLAAAVALSMPAQAQEIGCRVDAGYDRDGVVGSSQHVTSLDAQHPARSRRAGRYHRLYLESEITAPNGGVTFLNGRREPEFSCA
jgi:hypothetical protein